MRHPYKKFAQLQLLTLFISLFIGTIAFIQGSVFLALLSIITLSLSFLFEGIVAMKKDHTLLFGQQLLRAIIIILCAGFIYFY
ncbi:hypothetical protein NC661_10500 [Aquibacillus koreensis]|uniref:Uncharacterized protein n=1 Tax=Aquibacillus koreensis TaxID=279446 RepID=A0A9X3WLH5_9BACI|nr:hypothetical protein [Aquibacillus koreensis]MCT2538259.1 hypothetical protein [Aquibacillus koreensis]MDC3420798.1 hypothetical protein [Aquibacillus koreensis]